MSSENTLTGRNGKFQYDDQTIARTKQWAVNRALATKSEWGDSDSAGYTNRAAGRRDATFDVEGVYATDDEAYDIFQPEDVAAAALWMDATSLYWAFPRALCIDFKLMVNVDTEEVIGWQSSFGADGIFYHPGAAGAPSYSL